MEYKTQIWGHAAFLFIVSSVSGLSLMPQRRQPNVFLYLRLYYSMSNTGVSKSRSVSAFLCLTKQCPSFGHRVKQWRRISDSETWCCLQDFARKGQGILPSVRQVGVLPGFPDWTGYPLAIFWPGVP